MAYFFSASLGPGVVGGKGAGPFYEEWQRNGDRIKSEAKDDSPLSANADANHRPIRVKAALKDEPAEEVT